MGFVYESGNEITVVYTSEEAEQLFDPFEEDSSEPDPFIDSEIELDE